MSARTTKRYVIGIDGGVNTGIAVYDRSKRELTTCQTMTFWGVYEEIVNLRNPRETLIIIEDPEQNRPIFKHLHSQAAQSKLAGNVGGVKRESRLLMEGLRRRGFEVIAVRPTTGKVKADYFAQLTKWKGRTSQHARDAAMLCYGY